MILIVVNEMILFYFAFLSLAWSLSAVGAKISLATFFFKAERESGFFLADTYIEMKVEKVDQDFKVSF